MVEGSRRTVPGHVPTSWAKPHRSSVLTLALVALIADAFVFLTAPDGALDSHLAYGPQTVRDLLHALQEQGRAAYRLASGLDLAFVVLYSTLLVNWLRFFRNRRVKMWLGSPWLGLVPGLFDAVETTSILGLLYLYPEVPDALVWAAVVATPLKWLGVASLSLIIITGEVKWWKKRKRR